MILRKALMGTALGAFVLGSSIASAAPAIEAPRAPAKAVEGEEFIPGMGIGALIALVILVAVVVVIATDDGEDEPFSP